MKKVLISLGVIAAIAVAAFFIFRENKPKSLPIDADFAFYFDGKQLVDKSGILADLNESQRKTLGTMLASEFDRTNDTEYIQSLVVDLNNTGLNLSLPMYAYSNVDIESESYDMVAVAAVHDINLVDRFTEFALDLYNSNEGTNMSVERDGDIRIIRIENSNTLIGYNDRLAVAVGKSNAELDCRELLNSSLTLAYADLSIFGERDMAIYIDYNRLIDIMEYASKQESEYDIPEEFMAYCTKARETLSEDAAMVVGLSFLDGRVVIDGCAQGINTEASAYMGVTENANLRFLPDTLLAMLNLNIDGSKAVALLREMPTDTLSETLGIDSNEFNAGFQIVCDAIGSIDGDVILSLNNLEGKYNVNNVEALLMAEVKDDYILSNITMFAAPFFTRVDESNYTMRLGSNLSLYLGQDDTIFYTGVNDELAPELESATSARWMDDVTGSNGYMIIDIDNMASNNFINNALNEIKYEMSGDEAAIMDKIVDMSNYIYAKSYNNTNVELVWVLDNGDANALNQLYKAFVTPEMLQTLMQ